MFFYAMILIVIDKWYQYVYFIWDQQFIFNFYV